MAGKPKTRAKEAAQREAALKMSEEDKRIRRLLRDNKGFIHIRDRGN
jgi:hypothetical protein